jgi:hypothetical protein
VGDAIDSCLWSLFCKACRDLAQHYETLTTNLKSLRAKPATSLAARPPICDPSWWFVQVRRRFCEERFSMETLATVVTDGL